mmetsp:Transcript_94258/g.266172  ORF Transcript_94258/g.266172 Transcript_94258/m.266172 type:complete len:235 (-) Transcript_94258:1-705(-)
MYWSNAISGITKTGISTSPETSAGSSPGEWCICLPTTFFNIAIINRNAFFVGKLIGTYCSSSTPKNSSEVFGGTLNWIWRRASHNLFLPRKYSPYGYMQDLSNLGSWVARCMDRNFPLHNSFSKLLGSTSLPNTTPLHGIIDASSCGSLGAPRLSMNSAAFSDPRRPSHASPSGAFIVSPPLQAIQTKSRATSSTSTNAGVGKWRKTSSASWIIMATLSNDTPDANIIEPIVFP